MYNDNSSIDQNNSEYQIPNDGTYRLVPLINSDAVGGMHKLNDIGETDTEYIIKYIPFIDAFDNDFCIRVTSDSMIPTCPPGCVVQIREVENWREYFGYGNLFVIQLKDGRRIIKEVTKCDTNPKDYILCISHNKSVPPEELPKSFIVSVWKVIKVLTDRGW
ncbi:MAG: helix-turn-helix transcriptional regulator [Dysgonomonas sp.]